MISTSDLSSVLAIALFLVVVFIVGFLLLRWFSSGRAGVHAGKDYKRVNVDAEENQTEDNYDMSGRFVDVTDTAFSNYMIEHTLESLKETSKSSLMNETEKKWAIARLETLKNCPRGIGDYEYRVVIFRARMMLIVWKLRDVPLELYIKFYRKKGFKQFALSGGRQISGIIQRTKLPKGLRPLPGMRKQCEIALLLPREHSRDPKAIEAMNRFLLEAALPIGMMPLVSQAESELKVAKKMLQDAQNVIKKGDKDRAGDLSAQSGFREVIDMLREEAGTGKKFIRGIPGTALLVVPFITGMGVEYWATGVIDATITLGYALGIMVVWGYAHTR